MKCEECNGTGAYKPDCWLCGGSREITIKAAIDERYSLEELELYDLHYCRCPADECHGDSCDLCEGSGKMEDWRLEHEVTRVLIMAKTDFMPDRLFRLHNGRKVWDADALLSTFAAAICRDRGWINWFTSIFGDEIDLTEAGEQEFETRIHDWHKLHDSDNRSIDDFGRWADDGGLKPEHNGMPE